MENSQIREDTSMNESSLHGHRGLFKKQKSHSIVYGDLGFDNRPKTSNLNSKAHNTKKIEYKLPNQNEIDKKSNPIEKLMLSTEIHNQLGLHKKNESLDKNSLAKKQNIKSNKFFLNTSFKMFHFKSGSRQLDSVSKRSPSFSNSNLPTDLPTNKVNSSNNSSRPMISMHKTATGLKDKASVGKPVQRSLFEDYKSYTLYKSAMNNHSKFITNLRYPFFFEDVHDQDNEDPIRGDYMDPTLFDKANPKAISKWKEELKKKIEARKTKTKHSMQEQQ